MLLDPRTLQDNLDTLEEIEKASLRMVTEAIWQFSREAAEIFANETDLPGDIGEDITREALDTLGFSRIHQRLFGKIDYKKARYYFHPDYAIKQALFVDSKSEKISGQGTATIQTSQTSMRIIQLRSGNHYNVEGLLPTVLETGGEFYITTTIFVKYNYSEPAENTRRLESITIAGIPNGMLQAGYNPTEQDTIWIAGRNAPTRGEEFRVRLHFARLKAKTNWRVQRIQVIPDYNFTWDD